MHAVVAKSGKLLLQPWPAPLVGPLDLLIRVKAAGVNPDDLTRVISGSGARPWVPGQDVAGMVVQVGAAVSGFRVGEFVCAMTSAAALGAYAELVSVPAAAVAQLPAGLDPTEAASLPVSTLTAWQALFDYGGLRAGQRVLIHGAAGGVGCAAVQLALWRGAEVFGTTSAPHLAYVESLGAHFALDHAAQRFEAVVPEVDVVLDTLGGEFLRRSYGMVRLGGIVISIAEPPAADDLMAYQARGAYCQPQPDGYALARILDLTAARQLCPKIAGTFPLPQAAEALALAISPNVQGKVVLTIA